MCECEEKYIITTKYDVYDMKVFDSATMTKSTVNIIYGKRLQLITGPLRKAERTGRGKYEDKRSHRTICVILRKFIVLQI